MALKTEAEALHVIPENVETVLNLLYSVAETFYL